MSEAALMRRIQIACADADTRLWRNNVGTLKDATGRVVTFGLCAGSSDLIGLRSIVVTPEMVGKRVAVFTALEVKRKKGDQPAHQLAFIDTVQRLGGRAGFVTSVEDAMGVLR